MGPATAQHDPPQPTKEQMTAAKCLDADGLGFSEAHQEHISLNGECPWCGAYDKSKWLSPAAADDPQDTAAEPTIVVEGRTYRVERKDGPGGGEPEGPTYWLRGARDAVYFTMRNVHHPHRMFLVNGRSFTRSAPATWLTDETGELTVR